MGAIVIGGFMILMGIVLALVSLKLGLLLMGVGIAGIVMFIITGVEF